MMAWHSRCSHSWRLALQIEQQAGHICGPAVAWWATKQRTHINLGTLPDFTVTHITAAPGPQERFRQPLSNLASHWLAGSRSSHAKQRLPSVASCVRLSSPISSPHSVASSLSLTRRASAAIILTERILKCRLEPPWSHLAQSQPGLFSKWLCSPTRVWPSLSGCPTAKISACCRGHKAERTQ
jgi:hypothetical protein